MPGFTEEKARFWTVVFGGISTLGLVFGGLFAIIQYLSNQRAAGDTLAIQAATARFDAKKPFYARQLELCELASSQAAVIATPVTRAAPELARAKEEFWRLYWGPLGIVEDPAVEASMVTFARCMQGDERCGTLQQASLKLAHACRELAAKTWDVKLPPLGNEKHDAASPDRKK